MTENQITAKFLDLLRDRGWVCFKFNDRLTQGIPDASASGRGKTFWMEMKHVRLRMVNGAAEVLPSQIKTRRVQLENMVALRSRCTTAFYVFFYGGLKEMSFAIPTDVKQAINTPKPLTLEVRPVEWWIKEMEEWR